MVFWLQGYPGSYILVSVLDTGGTLIIVFLKAAQQSGVTIR